MMEGLIEGFRATMPTERKKNRRGANAAGLDDVNRRLLAELQDNARFSLAELGRRVGLTAPAVAERLQRLEETGIVCGYHAVLDPRTLGYTLGAVLRLRPAARELHRVADVARRTPEVVECHRITGEDCFIMKLHLRDIEHLEQVVDRFTPFGQTTTSLIQSSPVPARGLVLDPPDEPPSVRVASVRGHRSLPAGSQGAPADVQKSGSSATPSVRSRGLKRASR
jgi:Lrp/AsnC family leucine-responsive transcriptional regulator